MAGSNARAFDELARLRRSLEKIADRTAIATLAQRVGVAFVKQVSDEFRQSRDPYGNPWKPVYRNRKRDRNARAGDLGGRADKPLDDTGRMKNSVNAQPTGGSLVRILIPVDYATAHQYGAVIPRRSVGARFQPVNSRGRFTSKGSGRGKSQRVRFLAARTDVNEIRIPRRQMLPEAETGGLGPNFTRALLREADRLKRELFPKDGG